MRFLKAFKKLLCLVTALGILAAAAGCSYAVDKKEPRQKIYFSYFDTVSCVYTYADDSDDAFSENCRLVSDVLSKYHQLFDIYYEYEGVNNLCTVNRNAGGEALRVERELIDFLLYAEELYSLTNGEMNIMMGSVLSLWHDCREAASIDASNAKIPSDSELFEAAKRISFELLEIDAENNTLRISDPDASIDVGALGKGYAAEKAAEALSDRGVTSYVLNIGGNIRMLGEKPDGSGWVTAIKDPQAPDSNYIFRLDLKDASCVTSGVYERYFAVNGVRYHHIIDPDTLYPAERYLSVTVISKDSGLCDALSTALFCMSEKDGRSLIESIGNIEVLWVYADGSTSMTDGFSALIIE